MSQFSDPTPDPLLGTTVRQRLVDARTAARAGQRGRKRRNVRGGVGDVIDGLISADRFVRLRARPESYEGSSERADRAQVQMDALYGALDELLRIDADATLTALESSKFGVPWLDQHGGTFKDLGSAIVDHVIDALAADATTGDPFAPGPHQAAVGLRRLLDAPWDLGDDVKSRIHLGLARARESTHPDEAFADYRAAGALAEARRIALAHIEDVARTAPDAATSMARDRFDIDVSAEPEVAALIRTAHDKHLIDIDRSDLVGQWRHPDRPQADVDAPLTSDELAALRQRGMELFRAGKIAEAAVAFEGAGMLEPTGGRAPSDAWMQILRGPHDRPAVVAPPPLEGPDPTPAQGRGI